MLCPYILAMALVLSAAGDLADENFCDSVQGVWFPTEGGSHACFLKKQKCTSDVNTSQHWRDGEVTKTRSKRRRFNDGAIYTHLEDDSGKQIEGFCKWSIDFTLDLKMSTREKFCTDVNGLFKDLGHDYVCIISKSTCAPDVSAGSSTYSGTFVPGKTSSEEGDQVTQVQDADGRTIGICIWKRHRSILNTIIWGVVLASICCCPLGICFGICWCHYRNRKGATSYSTAPVIEGDSGLGSEKEENSKTPLFEVRCEA